MPRIKVDGKEIEAPPGQRLLEVLTDRGVTVPYYCWHPGLTPAGNCRMCLVKVSNSRKLEVSCMVVPTEGLEVTTEGPEIEAARKSVLEYMLVNHPLDCPICDKAGECMLQDHTYAYRKGLSRFQEHKVIRGTWDLGPHVKIWGNRCISCTRCVRFCDEISGTSELSIVNRGDHSVADVHPDVPLDNPMSLNTVDLCPVGALIDKNFLFQARVWFAERKPTICTSCSRGCNVTATVHQGQIKRLQPRHNAEVNDYWMCDAGRLNTGHVHAANRLTEGRGTLQGLVAALKAAPGRVGIVVSTANTLEEMFLARELAMAVGGVGGFLGKVQGQRWVSRSGFAIEVDKTPNRKGAELLSGGPPVSYTAVVDAVDAGKIDVLVVSNQIPDLAWPQDLVDAARKVKHLAVADLQQGPLTEVAHHVFPAACWAEKEGTYVNRDGRIQRGRTVVAPPHGAWPDLGWMQDVLVALGARRSALSAEGVFKQAFPALDYGKVGASGVAPTPAPIAPEDQITEEGTGSKGGGASRPPPATVASK